MIESKLDPGRGPVVTILIGRGTLEVGDAVVAGANWGRVRAMNDFLGHGVAGHIGHRQPEQRAMIAVHQRGEGGFIAVAESPELIRVLHGKVRIVPCDPG